MTAYRDARGRVGGDDLSDTDVPGLPEDLPPPADENAAMPFPPGWEPDGSAGSLPLARRLLARLQGRRFEGELEDVPTIKNRFLARVMRRQGVMRVQAPSFGYAAHVCMDGVVREDWKCPACCLCWQCVEVREALDREGTDLTDPDAVRAVAMRYFVAPGGPESDA